MIRIIQTSVTNPSLEAKYFFYPLGIGMNVGMIIQSVTSLKQSLLDIESCTSIIEHNFTFIKAYCPKLTTHFCRSCW